MEDREKLEEALADLRELGQELNNMGLDTEEHFNDTKQYVRKLMKVIKNNSRDHS